MSIRPCLSGCVRGAVLAAVAALVLASGAWAGGAARNGAQLYTVTFAGAGQFERHGQTPPGLCGGAPTYSDTTSFSWSETWKNVNLTSAGVTNGTGYLKGTATEKHVTFPLPTPSGACKPQTCNKSFAVGNPHEEKGFYPLVLKVTPTLGGSSFTVDVPNGATGGAGQCIEVFGQNPLMLATDAAKQAFLTPVAMKPGELNGTGPKKLVVSVRNGPLSTNNLTNVSCSPVDPKNFPCVENETWKGTVTVSRQ